MGQLRITYKSTPNPICGVCGSKREAYPNGRWRCRACANKGLAKYRRVSATYKTRKKEQNKKPSARFSQLRYMARKRKLEMTLTFTQWQAFQNDLCYYCSGPLDPTGSGLDRIDNTQGYTETNVVACCGLCNKVKRDYFTIEEMVILGGVIKELKLKRMMACETEGGGQWRS